MGDVLMIKNDSGIKSATGLTGSGSRDWIVQRISAVVLAVYSVVLLGFFLTHDVTYEAWSGFMMSLPMRLFSLVAIIALAGHAWVGMWTVFTDYITTSKLGPISLSATFGTTSRHDHCHLSVPILGHHDFLGQSSRLTQHHTSIAVIGISQSKHPY